MIDQKVGSTHLFANMCAEERVQEQDLELHTPAWDLRPALFKGHQKIHTEARPVR